MRKTGLIFTLLGGTVGILTFLVRMTAWYASVSANHLSEFAEFIESAFWAGVITLVAGFFLLLLSLRHPKQMPTEYGTDTEEGYSEEEYSEDGYSEDGYVPEPELFDRPERTAFKDPWVPDPADTVRMPDGEKAQQAEQEDWVCAICGCRNPEFSRICAVCGSSRGNRI